MFSLKMLQPVPDPPSRGALVTREELIELERCPDYCSRLCVLPGGFRVRKAASLLSDHGIRF